MPIYTYNGKTYNVPEESMSQFEAKAPNASIRYTNNGNLYDIPLSHRDAFLKKAPTATYYSAEADKADLESQMDAWHTANGEFMKQYEDAESVSGRQIDNMGMPATTPQSQFVYDNRQEYGLKRNEIETLRKRYFSNPLVIQEREGNAGIARQMAEQYAGMAEQMAKDNPELARKARATNAVALNPRGFMSGMVSDEIRAYNDDKSNYDTARRMAEEARDIYAAPSRYDDSVGVVNFMKGGRDVLKKADFWTMGMVGIADNLNAADALRKVQDKLGNVSDLSEENIDKILTPSEKAVVLSFAANVDAQASRAHDLSLGYQSGQGATESLGFMAQFLLTGGVANTAANAATKGLTNWLAKGLGKMSSGAVKSVAKGAAKFSLGTIKSLTKAAVQTPLMPSTYANIAEQMTTITDTGRLMEANEAFWYGLADSMVETWSESAGGLVESVMGLPMKAGSNIFHKALGDTAFGRWGQSLTRTPAFKMMKQAGWNGYLGEMGEEWFGNSVRTLTGLDPDALKDFATVDNQIVTATSFAPMAVFGFAGSAAQYGAAKRRVTNAANSLANVMQKNGYTEEQIAFVTDEINATNPRQLSDTLTPVVNQIAKDTGNGSDALKATMEYADAVAKYRTLDGFYQREQEQQREDKKNEIMQNAGTFFWQTHKTDKTGADGTPYEVNEVRVLEFADGRIGYVTVSDEAGNNGILYQNGETAFLTDTDIQEMFTDGRITSDREMMLDDYLSEEVAKLRQSEEAQRMQTERDASIQELQRTYQPGVTMPIGTEENPVNATVMEQTADGVILKDANGTIIPKSWEELGNIVGVRVNPMTDVEILEADIDAIGVERQARKGEITETPSIAEVALEEVVNPLPLLDNGEVDQNTLWNREPERWAEWNDAQRQDGGLNSAAYINDAITKETAALTELQNAYAAESDLNNGRPAIEKEINEKQQRLERLAALAQKYVPQSMEEITQGDQQPAQAPVQEVKTEQAQTTPSVEQTIIDLFSDESLSEDEIEQYVDANVSGSQSDLDRHLNKAPKMGRDMDKYKEARATHQKKTEELTAVRDFWRDVKRYLSGTSVEMDMEPQNALEAAAKELTRKDGIKLLPESFRQHTGYGRGEQAVFRSIFRKKEKGGMTLEAAGERLMADYPEFFDQNDPNAGLNAILEVLQSASSSGDLSNYIANVREEMAQQEKDAVRGAIMQQVEEAKKLSEQEANAIIQRMQENAEIAPELELTPENWIAEFGENGIVATPIGDVKMGEHQYFKLAQKGRSGKLGMVKPTLSNPDVIIEDKSSRNTDNAERESSYIFVKTFQKGDGSRYYHFTSVTVLKDGKEVSISNQEKSANKISKLLQNEEIAWIKSFDSLHPTSQVEESVPLNDSRNSTLTDNEVSGLGINSPIEDSSQEVYNRHTTERQSAETAEVSQDVEQSGTQTSSSTMTTTSSSESKDSNNQTIASDSEENFAEDTAETEDVGDIPDDIWWADKYTIEKLNDQKRTVAMYSRYAKESNSSYWADNVKREEFKISVIEKDIEEEKQRLLTKGVNVDDIELQTSQSQKAIDEIREKIDNLKEFQQRLAEKYSKENEEKAKERANRLPQYLKERKAENAQGFYKIRPKENENPVNTEDSEESEMYRTIQGLEAYTQDEVVDMAVDFFNGRFEGEDGIELVKITPIGSRVTGTAKAESDLDLLVEYDGNWREDTVFDILNDNPMEIDGITVDFFPITEGKSGNTSKWLKSHGYDNTDATPKEIVMHAERLAAKLGTKVKIITSLNDITDSDKNRQNRRRSAKGWYSKSSGEVVLVLPNAESIADAQATILHEIVAHKGLREMFGKDFDTFLENVYANASEEVREKIDAMAQSYKGDTNKATEEYIAQLAERGFDNQQERSLWQKVKDLFIDLLRKVGIRLDKPLTDDDLRYILWRSYQMQLNKGVFGVAEDVVMREKLGIGRKGDIRFRTSDFGEVYEQFRGKPKEAIAFLMEKQSGEAIGALSHKDIGEIDLVWGEAGTGKSDGYGLAKLVKYHPEVVDNLQEIIDEMEITKRSPNRIQLESEKYQAAVRLTWDNQKKTWLLTAFEKKNSVLDNTTDTDETSKGSKQNDTATLQDTVSDSKGNNNSADSNTRFRIRKENESAMDFHQRVVDEYKSRYKDIADIEVFPIDEKTAKRFGYTIEELQTIGGVYVPDEDLIAIFAQEDRVNSVQVEETLFHESIHKLEDFFGYFNKVGEWMWQMADKYRGFAVCKAEIEEEYEKDEHIEEMLCYMLGRAMAHGKIDILFSKMPDKIKDYCEQILNEIGYDRQERPAARIQRLVDERPVGTGITQESRLKDESGRGDAKKKEGGRGSQEAGEDLSYRVSGTPTEDIVVDGLNLTPQQVTRLAGNIFAALPIESRKKITDELKDPTKLQDAIMQIPVRLAMTENWSDEDIETAKIVASEVEKMIDTPMTRHLTASEALWMLYNATHPVTDYDVIGQASRAVVARNLGFDKQTLDMEQEAEDDVMYRIVGDASINAAASMYNKGAANVWSRLRESFVDMYDSVDKLIKSIEKSSGNTAQAFEDVRKALNQQASKGLAVMESYTRKFLEPMFNEISKIMKATRKTYDDVVRYVILKSGLERNDELAKRDAREYYQAEFNKELAAINGDKSLSDEKKQEKAEQAKSDLDFHLESIDRGSDEKYHEFRESDYSGLSSMFYEQLGINREDYGTDEEYQSALMLAKKDKYKNLADVEKAAKAEVEAFENEISTDNLWKRINAATKETLRQQYHANMISKDQYEQLSGMFKFYVPLRGFKDNTAEDMYTYSNKPNGTGYVKPILGAKGRKTEAESPFGWIAAMANSAIASNVKNKSKLALYYFVSNRPDNGVVTVSKTWYKFTGERDEKGRKVFEPVYPTFKDGLSNSDQKDAYDKWVADMKDLEAKGDAYQGRKRLDLGNSVVNIEKANKHEHVITVRVGGQEYTMIVNGNPRAAQAINGQLNVETVGDYSGLFGPVMRWMSNVNTSYNPEFWLTNLQRDMLFTLMAVNVKENSEYSRKFRKNYRKAFAVVSLAKKYENGELGDSHIEKLYKEFVENGGVTGFTQIKGNEQWEKEISRYMKSANLEDRKLGALMHGVKQGFQNLHRFGESLEQVSRFAAYITSREMGTNVIDSVASAKEITVNFNRKGSGRRITLEEAKHLTNDKGQPLTQVQQWLVVGASSIAPLGRRFIMFFNASVQSLNNVYNLYKGNPRKMTAWSLGFFALGVMNAALHAMLDDDDDYLDIPDYERRNNILIGGGGAYFKWAIPHEARMFYALGDLAVNSIMGRNPHQNIIGEAFKIASETLPINPSEGWRALMPSAALPVAELVINEDYKGAPIYNDLKWLTDEERKKTAKWNKAYAGTGKLYINISKALNNLTGGDYADAGWINIRPESMEHIMQSAFGGTIRTVDKLFTSVTNLITGEEMTMKNAPMLNRIMTLTDDRYRNIHVNDLYYYYKAEAEHARVLEREYTKANDYDELRKLRKSDEYEYYKIYSRYKKAIKKKQDAIRAAENSAERRRLTEEQDALKQRMIEEISRL